VDIEWRLGIGDPTFAGWLTVVVYFAAAALSFRASGFAQLSAQHWKKEAMFWLLIALTMVALSGSTSNSTFRHSSLNSHARGRKMAGGTASGVVFRWRSLRRCSPAL
jgi:hypothetical protein